MTNAKTKFTLGRKEEKKKPDPVNIDTFVSGEEPETTKTFRLSVRLSRQLKLHAVKTGQKEKDILIQLIENYLAEKAD